MKSLKHIFIPIIALLLLNFSVWAQTNTSAKLSKQQTWQLLDYEQDTVYGTSVNRAYKELLKGKKSHQVIVAVIDLGVDISQEDLQGHIWTNKKEIAGNGIDDDHNGYVDDVHGWNFIGGKDGRIMYAESSEADREYARLFPEYGSITDSSLADNKTEYRFFLKMKKMHEKDSINRKNTMYPMLSRMCDQLITSDSILKMAMQKQAIYFKEVEAFQPKDSLAKRAKKNVLDFYASSQQNLKSMSLDSGIIKMEEFMDILKDQQLQYSKLKSDPNGLRKEIVGDNPFDINDGYYGNNIVGDKYSDHGTHCAGIIAAIRNNGIGIDGVADNVMIMPLWILNPIQFGRHRDKDIALAIRYAADNGARIINISWGKEFFPQQQWVLDATSYAVKKGVLFVQAVGNDHADIDIKSEYLNADFIDSSLRSTNLISVGAISIDTGFTLPGWFSNYGQKKVDLFAPGMAIYSTVTGNKYDFESGTSMAAPVVAGVAALILEYYPNLNAEQVKDIILKSVTSLKGKIVYKPNSLEKVDFATLCVTGGVVNAYKALQLAEHYK